MIDEWEQIYYQMEATKHYNELYAAVEVYVRTRIDGQLVSDDATTNDGN